MKFRNLRWHNGFHGGLCCAALVLSGCGPRVRIPPLSPERLHLPGVLPTADSRAGLARSLAPVLYIHRDETFPLERVVAVIHPDRRLIAYHLLWRDDVHGAWIPFTRATDQEIVWIGYDSTLAPTEMWTYWHGKILRTDWRDRGTPLVNVQWGKHGSLPRGVIESDLPRWGKLPSFYLFTWAGLWDTWLGTLTRPGPVCFCRGYDRYREFTRPLVLGERVDVVAELLDPAPVLSAVFGKYSRKPPWPDS